MPRKVRTHVGEIEPQQPALNPRHLTKQEFGKRVYNLMVRKGWNQSELARQADLNRDAVSTYIRGRTFPTPTNLKALASALGVLPEELLPNHIESAIEEDNPSFEMRASTSAPSTVWLRVNRLVSMSTAVRIAELLENDKVLHRGGSGEPAAVQPLKSQTA